MMSIFKTLREAVSGFVQGLQSAWWVEIITVQPSCVYYFGPFNQPDEAQAACPGYLEDLQNEGAQQLKVDIKYCRPKDLTICYEE